MTEFARLLSEHEGVTVVTNALNVALHLVENPRLRVFAAGGEIRSSDDRAPDDQISRIRAGGCDVALA